VIPSRKFLLTSSPQTTTALHLGRLLHESKQQTSKKHCETTTTVIVMRWHVVNLRRTSQRIWGMFLV